MQTLPGQNVLNSTIVLYTMLKLKIIGRMSLSKIQSTLGTSTFKIIIWLKQGKEKLAQIGKLFLSDARTIKLYQMDLKQKS